MTAATAIACAAVVALAWAVVTASRASRLARMASRRAAARPALSAFGERTLEMSSVADILATASSTARELFGVYGIIVLEPAEDGSWMASSPGQGPMAPPPPRASSLFSWFRHNPLIAVREDLGDPRYGAMRGPLAEVMDAYVLDALLPLVDRERVLAVLGLCLGRKPSALDRELLRLFRLECAAACANVKLHHQAAHMVSLAREVDLASSIELAMVPDELEGRADGLRWAGHYTAAGRAGSDFFGVYPLAGGKVMVVIGDAVGHDLAGTMVSAVVKSCCDAIFEGRPEQIDPSQLLAFLNGSLWRPSRPALTSCFAALFDPAQETVFYANAGHVAPFRLWTDPGGQLEIGSLSGTGPLLGDTMSPDFILRSAPVRAGECFLFLSDGVLKARDRSGHAFGDRRLVRALRGAGEIDPRRLRQHLAAELRRFRAGAEPTDDEAFLVLRLG